MGHSLKHCFLILLLALNFGAFIATENGMDSNTSLVARLKLDDQSSNCWDSLIQLQACTGEIILFFLNGEAYLGPSCCQAIRIVGKQCWPNLLDSLGYTTQEGDILQDYCDADEVNSYSHSSSSTTEFDSKGDLVH